MVQAVSPGGYGSSIAQTKAQHVDEVVWGWVMAAGVGGDGPVDPSFQPPTDGVGCQKELWLPGRDRAPSKGVGPLPPKKQPCLLFKRVGKCVGTCVGTCVGKCVGKCVGTCVGFWGGGAKF